MAHYDDDGEITFSCLLSVSAESAVASHREVKRCQNEPTLVEGKNSDGTGFFLHFLGALQEFFFFFISGSSKKKKKKQQRRKESQMLSPITVSHGQLSPLSCWTVRGECDCMCSTRSAHYYNRQLPIINEIWYNT